MGIRSSPGVLAIFFSLAFRDHEHGFRLSEKSYSHHPGSYAGVSRCRLGQRDSFDRLVAISRALSSSADIAVSDILPRFVVYGFVFADFSSTQVEADNPRKLRCYDRKTFYSRSDAFSL